ncbi:MAG: xanthine dehydrogenase family protein molybdopterin-binding subunit [Armatimonadaceae bacterium]
MPETTNEEPMEVLEGQPPQKKTRKVKRTVVENGIEKEIEVEEEIVEDQLPVSWGTKSDRKVVGSPISRVDGFDKVTGRAKYTFDINRPGMLWGHILRSPVAKGRIIEVDLEPAKKMPGVKAAIALKNNGAIVRYHGEEVAAVAATSPEIAEDALRAIVVKYEFLPFAVKPEDAMLPEAPQVVGGDQKNVQTGNVSERGNVAEGFARAAATVEGEYAVQGRVHASLETHGHVIEPTPDGGLMVWSSTQAVHDTAGEFARMANVPKEKVVLTCDHMGGGFGSKFGARPEGYIGYQLAKATNAPIKMMLDRAGEALASGHAPSAAVKVKLAGSKDGKITAIEAEGWGSGGLGGGGFPYPYIYQVESQKVKRDTVRTNIQPSAAMRAPGHPQASFLMEGIVDDLAYKLGIDPLEFRMKNDPFPIRQAEYKIGAEKIGWAKNFNKNPGSGGSKVRGVGVASATWGGGGGNPDLMAEVHIARDGSVEVRMGTQDLGTGVRTFFPSIVADELKVPHDAIKPMIGKSTLPYAPGSGGSTTTPSVAPPVKVAAAQAKADFLAAIAKATSTPAEKLTLTDGGTVTDGSKRWSWKEACQMLPAEGLTSRGNWRQDLIQPGIGGVQFAYVEVDQETGRVRPLKIVAVQDCGIVLNHLTVVSQINGGIIQGIGFALTEDQVYDRQTGRMLNPNLEEYKLPGPWEMPEIEVVMYEPEGLKGVSGMAEAPVIPTAAAIANAVYNATGVRVTRLPLTPAHVLEAMGKAGKG